MSDCAVADDGTLKDANNIQWFNDADDNVPIPASRPLTASSSVSSVTSLDDYFASRPPVCILYAVQGSNRKITWTEPVEPVLRGPVQGSRIPLNRTIGPVQGSSKMPFELDRTEPWHHYYNIRENVKIYIVFNI